MSAGALICGGIFLLQQLRRRSKENFKWGLLEAPIS